jgi:dihydroxy-acid dehydratase
MADIDASRAGCRALQGRAQHRSYHMEDVHRAGGIVGDPGRTRPRGPAQRRRPRRARRHLGRLAGRVGHRGGSPEPRRAASSTSSTPRPAASAPPIAFSQDQPWASLDIDAATAASATRSTPTPRRRPRRPHGNLAPDGCVVKTAGVPSTVWRFAGPARSSSPRRAPSSGILSGQIKAGDVVVMRYEGPKGGPGMQEMLYPTSYLKGVGLGQGMRPDHRWPLLRRHLGAVDRARLARGRQRWRHRAGRRWRRHRDRHPARGFLLGCHGPNHTTTAEKRRSR